MKRRDFLRLSTTAAMLAATPYLKANSGQPKLKLTTVGDCILTRRVSHLRDSAFLGVTQLLRDSDCAIGNCEMLFGDVSALEPAPKGYDMNLLCEPFGADELRWLGLDLVSLANNHAMDYGAAGLRSTRALLDKGDIASAGAGPNLTQAAAPAYADTAAGRVALIGCAATFPAWSLAEDARGDISGRPGINPLRLDFTSRLEPALFAQLQQIEVAIGEADGPVKSNSKELKLLDRRFVVGANGTDVVPQTGDVDRILATIKVARRNARFVVVGIHEHSHFSADSYLPAFAHRCIDAGADIFWCAGPHVPGGIEIYQGKPVFYSLGNFFFQYDTVKQVPRGVYEAYDLDAATPDPSRAYDVMTDRYFAKNPAYWESFVPEMIFEGRNLTELRLHPLTLGWSAERYARGVPALAAKEPAAAILRKLQELAKPFGTTIETHDGTGMVKF